MGNGWLLLPEYLFRRNISKTIKIGEITIFDYGSPDRVITECTDWLRIRGLQNSIWHLLYEEGQVSFGKQLSDLGGEFVGSHTVWTSSIKGPIDDFFGGSK